MPRTGSHLTPPPPDPNSIGGRLAAAIRDWPMRPLHGWSTDEAINALSGLSHVHVDTIKRILDGRTLNPQFVKLRAMAANLGVSESSLRRGQEELPFTGRPPVTQSPIRANKRPMDASGPSRTALDEILGEIERIPSELTRVRAFRAATDAIIRSVVEDGEVLTTAYDTVAVLDAWLAAEHRRARTGMRAQR